VLAPTQVTQAYIRSQGTMRSLLACY
jgi:hypothetical protein